MLDILRKFLVDTELARDLVQVNIAAGEARQQLDDLLDNVDALVDARVKLDTLIQTINETAEKHDIQIQT